MAAHVKVDPVERLQEEHKAWKRNHPRDFIANPTKIENGELDWLTWRCAIPGPKKTSWEGGLFPIRLEFPKDYPYSPPKCVFNPPIFHPNVFPSGTVSLSLIEKHKGWKPQVTVKQVLVGIQLLLSDPNFQEPAQAEAFVVYTSCDSSPEDLLLCFRDLQNYALPLGIQKKKTTQSRMDYENRVKKLAKEMAPGSSQVLNDLLGTALEQNLINWSDTA